MRCPNARNSSFVCVRLLIMPLAGTCVPGAPLSPAAEFGDTPQAHRTNFNTQHARSVSVRACVLAPMRGERAGGRADRPAGVAINA